MSFKAIINKIAKENNVAAQSVLQTYMLERLLENNFYAEGIKYSDLITSIEKVGYILDE